MEPDERARRLLRRVLVAGFGAVGALAGATVAVGDPGLAVAPVGDVLRDATPPVLVNALLDRAPGLAESLFVAGAGALAVAWVTVVILAATAVAERADAEPRLPAGAATVPAVWLATGSALAGIVAGVATWAVLGVAGLATPPRVHFASRRRTVQFAAVAAGGTWVAAIARRVLRRPFPPEIDLDEDAAAAVEERLATAEERSFDLNAPGLVSTIDEFYEVDINTSPPRIDAADWGFRIDGAVGSTVRLGYDDLLAEPAATRAATLRCIGEPVAGNQLDTAVWTGVSLDRLLDRAGPEGEYVVVHAEDDYYETFPVEYLRGGLLAYAMNGRALPFEHGYPARLVMPGTWGKINVKWVSRIEVREEPGEGYWSRQGWNATAPMRIVAKPWHAAWDGDTVEVGGHAYAGDRGISAVEVSVDGGDTWHEAELSEPLPDDATWRQWRYEWAAERDEYEVVARAVDGEGRRQEEEFSTPFPDGATGWVNRTVSR